MKQLTKSFWLIFAFVSLLIVGCNKNESSPSGSQIDPAKASERVNQANQIFIPRMAMLISSQGSDTADFDMAAATSLYEEALSYDPNNLDAHFGVALTEVLTVFADPTLVNLFESSSSTIPASHPLNLPLSVFGKRGDLVHLSSVLRGGVFARLSLVAAPASRLKMYRTMRVADANRQFSYYQGVVESKLLPVLSDALAHLGRVTQNTNYVFYVTPQEMGQTSGDSIRISLTEIYMLLAFLQYIDADASWLVAYNVDYTPTDSAAVLEAWQLTSPFLTLRTGGAQRMKDVKSNFLGLATSIQNGIAFFRGHPGSGTIQYSPGDDPQLNSIVMAMDTLQRYLSGPTQIYGDFNDDGIYQNLTVNFANVFDNAITNFKQKIPAYTAGVQRDGSTFDPVLTWQANSFSSWTFPDPTFNGLFPTMASDAQLKATFGITAADWSQQTVVHPGQNIFSVIDLFNLSELFLYFGGF
ncbi:MAG: hypothetical protein ABSF91_01280 [Bacteroidota bacterium]|jgi:hypothetical protein